MTTPPIIRTTSPRLRYAYTDAPDLHPNLFVASLQLIFWFFFHPTAWQNYIARIAPDLRPDFWLLELTPAHWQDPRLRRLLVIGYGLWPLLGGGMVSVVGWLTGIPIQAIMINTLFAIVSSIMLGMMIGITSGIAIVIAFTGAGSLGLGMAGGLIGYLAAQMAIHSSTYSMMRQARGAFVGVIISCLAIIVAWGLGIGVSLALAIGLAFGIAFALRTGNWFLGTAGFLCVSVVCSGATLSLGHVAMGTALERAAQGVILGGLTASLFALSFVLTEKLGGPWAGAVAGALGVVGFWSAFFIGQTPQKFLWILALSLLGMAAGLTLSSWRPILTYPGIGVWNTILYFLDLRRRDGQPMCLCYHAAFWDEHQSFPWLGLDKYLVMVAERNPAEGQVAIAYLTTSPQLWAAQAARIELGAHHLERCKDFEGVRHAYQTLIARDTQGSTHLLLRNFNQISRDIDAALQQERNYNRRLALNLVKSRLDNLTRELDDSSEEAARRFRPIAVQWRHIVVGYTQKLTEVIEQRQEIDSPYVIGIPLNEQQEIFIGRTDIGSRIEQLLLDKRRPPLLLYGQRRMGKTSLLNNLGRLLPSTIVPLYVDLQGAPAAATNSAGLLYNIARTMIEAAQTQHGLTLPPLRREELSQDPFTTFDEWLDMVEHYLGKDTALLMLDEFEALDNAINKGRFDKDDILSLLRHLIQHRPKFKLLLAGSHTLEEYHRWASYLINIQVVQVSYLIEEEARLLVEYPVKDFALRYESSASQRVLDLTHCHPFLVQLLCAEIVALKNEQDPSVRRLAILADVEAAVPEALKSGSFFFADIERNQVDDAGRAILQCMAARGEGNITPRTLLAQVCPTNLDVTLKLLIQRELIQLAGDGYRFQVELIRRWFAQAD